MTRRVTPSGPSTEWVERSSASDFFSSKPSSPRSTRPLGRTGRSLIRSAAIPRVRARFGLVSPSMARTLCPSRAISRARVPEIEVFPDPPLPAIASFIASPPLSASYRYRGYRPLTAGRPSATQPANQPSESVYRSRIVTWNEVVDVGHRGPHPDGEGLHVDV